MTRVTIVALLLLGLAGGAAGAASEANVGLVFAQQVGPLARGETRPNRYLCAALPSGANQHKVTAFDGAAVDPDVSPLGSEIAYVSSLTAPLGSLERVATGGGDGVALAGGIIAAWPTWSADGRGVFFSSSGTSSLAADLDLYFVPREGGQPTRFLGGPLREAMPAAGGGRVVFVRSDTTRPSVSPGQLWLVREDGSDLRRLNIDDASSPDISTDGSRIVYVAPEGIRIVTLDPQGSRISQVLVQGTNPEFSPDGTRIAFVSGGDVWTMSLDGTEQLNLTNSRIAESAPTWQAAGAPAGGAEPCALVGTKGNDVVTGSPYRDVVYDGTGDDVYRTLDGDDIVYDGQGSDRYETGGGADHISLAEGSNTADGGAGDDAIFGSQVPDRLIGGDGDDALYGARGADVIFGGPGSDVIEGNRGDDAIDGGLGDDVLSGGPISGSPASYDGYDVLLGRGGNDRMTGGWQKDRLFGGPGSDRLRGGPHADHLVGEAGVDDVAGETGDDLLLAQDRTRDGLSGGPGFDRARLDAFDRRGGIERILP